MFGLGLGSGTTAAGGAGVALAHGRALVYNRPEVAGTGPATSRCKGGMPMQHLVSLRFLGPTDTLGARWRARLHWQDRWGRPQRFDHANDDRFFGASAAVLATLAGRCGRRHTVADWWQLSVRDFAVLVRCKE